MATKIVLTIDDGLTESEANDLRYLLSDALGEFAASRLRGGSAEAYVEGRYPGPDYYPDRTEKVEQVKRRIDLAKKMHNPALSFEILQYPAYVNHSICTEPCGPNCMNTNQGDRT